MAYMIHGIGRPDSGSTSRNTRLESLRCGDPLLIERNTIAGSRRKISITQVGGTLSIGEFFYVITVCITTLKRTVGEGCPDPRA